MKRSKRRRRFTLLEVIVAIAILSVSVVVLLQLTMSAQKRTIKSQDNWHRTHMLMQGAEYILLHSRETTSIPSQFFPYNDYKIVVSYEDAKGLPDEYDTLAGQLPLYACKISLIRLSDGKELDSIIVDRIGYETELSE